MIRETEIQELDLVSRGKVRDIYELQNDLLIITTDRVSAFDHILTSTIPMKGKVLNQLSLFFFEMVEDIIDNHVIHADFSKLPRFLRQYDYLKGRFMVAKKAQPLPVECIVRGYITGSGYREYTESHTIGGMRIDEELVESERFPEPIFTPSTKAEEGHDENISYDEMKTIIPEYSDIVRDTSLAIYKKAAEYALSRGIIIADTKMEFGVYEDNLIIIDELLTPDSSRFWSAESYKKGEKQQSMDKQYIRDYLLSTEWDRNSAPPELPEDVIEKTSQIYLNTYRLLTGNDLS
ncbi:MAG: phosphoribosylaminoimidazolesuccinocarboxamide synthase [bacterium]